jgi:hypothetical protein
MKRILLKSEDRIERAAASCRAAAGSCVSTLEARTAHPSDLAVFGIPISPAFAGS